MYYNHQEVYEAVESAALAAYEWLGKKDKLAADKAATDALRLHLNRINFAAKVEIGEYEKDKSFGLQFDEKIGAWLQKYPSSNCIGTDMLGNPMVFDYTPNIDFGIAVDPLECTTSLSNGGPGAMSVLAISKAGSFYNSRSHYMMKVHFKRDMMALAYINKINKKEEFIFNIPALLEDFQKAMNRTINVYLLDRDRNNNAIKICKDAGANVVLIQDGDISPCLFDNCDIYLGIGGTTEGVLAAAACKCTGDIFYGAACDKEGNLTEDGVLLNKDKLVKNNCQFYAVGITDGDILDGVEETPFGLRLMGYYGNTETKTLRTIVTHKLD